MVSSLMCYGMGVGQACLPASTPPPPPEHLLCASFWGHNGGKADTTGPLGTHRGAEGSGEVTLSQAAYQMQDATKGRGAELHPRGPIQH